MIDILQLDSATAAFIAGLTTSVHCVGMCGPIGCSLFPMGSGQSSVHWASATYHASRAISYTLCGTLAGLLGSGFTHFFELSATRILPWVFVAALLVLAFRLDRFIPKPKGWHRLYFRISQRVRRLPKWSLGLGLGFFTPLLPCGPLYLIWAAALFSGSALHGAELGLGFALGTIPLLWLAQSGYFLFGGRLQMPTLRRIQCVLALAVAGIITWRMISSQGQFGELFCH